MPAGQAVNAVNDERRAAHEDRRNCDTWRHPIVHTVLYCLRLCYFWQVQQAGREEWVPASVEGVDYMPRQAIKEWKAPKPQEVYTETLRPNEKALTKDYAKKDGDMYALIAEFSVVSLSHRAAWKEAMRAARAVVTQYLINRVVVEWFPKTDTYTFETVKVYEIFNLDALASSVSSRTESKQ